MNEVDQLAVVVREGDAATNGNGNGGPLTEPLFPLTDMGNAERLVAKHGRNARYVNQWGRWYIWDGQRWQHDTTGMIERLAAETVRDIRLEAGRIGDAEGSQLVWKHALRSESGPKVREMIRMAQTRVPVATSPDIFDRDPMVLTTTNGTLDLATGKLREHRREDYISRSCAVPYIPDCPTPIWTAALKRWTGDNKNLEDFIQRAIGASITGFASDEVFFFLYGPGRNGKSQFIKAIRHMLGDYARNIRPEALMVTQSGGIPNELAALVGIRFVSTAEVEEGSRMAESLVKQLTGGDPISVRFLHAEFFEMQPVMSLWMAGNHRPDVRGTDLAIWERILTVPFTVTIPPEERDEHLTEKLRKESPGILAWAAQGCLAWLKHGLKPPEEVKAATAEYREDMDVLGQFIGDCCITHDRAVVAFGRLYNRYTEWAKESGQARPWSKQLFGRKLGERPEFEKTRDGQTRVWEGLDLKSAQGSHS